MIIGLQRGKFTQGSRIRLACLGLRDLLVTQNVTGSVVKDKPVAIQNFFLVSMLYGKNSSLEMYLWRLFPGYKT